jgi:hypothetical protein
MSTPLGSTSLTARRSARRKPNDCPVMAKMAVVSRRISTVFCALAEAVLLAEQGRIAVLYRTATLGDGRYLLAVTDSAGNTAHDTLNVHFPVPTSNARKAAPPAGTIVEGNPRVIFRQGQVRFRFPVPVILAAGKPLGTLAEDSVKRRPLRLPADGSLSLDRTELTINLDTKAQKTVEIRLDTTAILAITGQSLFDLQLLDDKYQVVRQLRSPKGRFRFDRLPPGSYRFRVLIDSDGDGQWRSGDPNLRLPPEPVFVSPTLYKVRANFEIDDKLAF